jgi:flagellar biosynthesis/type III secretory pathway chaperone
MPLIEAALADLLEELRRVLEEERRIMLSGVPSRLDAVTQHKLALADAIESQTQADVSATADLHELKALARYNRENSIICGALLRHMTAALDRLRQRDPHRSYRADGSEHNPPSQRLVGAA